MLMAPHRVMDMILNIFKEIGDLKLSGNKIKRSNSSVFLLKSGSTHGC